MKQLIIIFGLILSLLLPVEMQGETPAWSRDRLPPGHRRRLLSGSGWSANGELLTFLTHSVTCSSHCID